MLGCLPFQRLMGPLLDGLNSKWSSLSTLGFVGQVRDEGYGKGAWFSFHLDGRVQVKPAANLFTGKFSMVLLSPLPTLEYQKGDLCIKVLFIPLVPSKSLSPVQFLFLTFTCSVPLYHLHLFSFFKIAATSATICLSMASSQCPVLQVINLPMLLFVCWIIVRKLGSEGKKNTAFKRCALFIFYFSSRWWCTQTKRSCCCRYQRWLCCRLFRL